MSQRLRLLFLADGQSVHTKRWVRWFAREHDVRLLSSPPLNGAAWDEPTIQLWPGSMDKIIPKVNSLRVFGHLQQAIREFRPDVLHAHFLYPNAWLAAATGFQPFVTSTWGSDVLRVNSLFQRFNVWALRKAALNTSDNRQMVEHLIALGAPADRLVYIQHGVDTERFSPGQVAPTVYQKWNLPDDAQVIICPRILRPLYNTVTIAQAFIHLAQEFPRAHLLILAYHQDEQYAAEVRQILQTGGVLDRVRFLERIPHELMPDFYRIASVMVSVPDSDTTPVTLLEAMACGTVSVVSDLPGIHEWVRDGVNGYIVPARDASALAQAIKKSLRLTTPQRQSMVAENRRLAVEHGGYDTNMRLMETHYRRLAAK